MTGVSENEEDPLFLGIDIFSHAWDAGFDDSLGFPERNETGQVTVPIRSMTNCSAPGSETFQYNESITFPIVE